jgi:ribonuclease P protein component
MNGDLLAKDSKDKKREHLRKADDISSVFSFKCRVSSEHLVALGKPNYLEFPRLVIMVAKKTNRLAVRRNYMRRVIRECFHKNRSNLISLDIVLRITKTFEKQDFCIINQEINQIFNRLSKCRAS